MTCIGCPMGCQLEVETRADGTVGVTGQACPRGESYAKKERAAPERMVTALVRVKGTGKPLSVKTKTAIPKAKIADVLAVLAATEVTAPVAIGDVVVADVCGTGVPVVATSPYPVA
ncbi:MAG: DUF1667 domain-containing protein [Kiritimatiellia bacterium]